MRDHPNMACKDLSRGQIYRSSLSSLSNGARLLSAFHAFVYNRGRLILLRRGQQHHRINGHSERMFATPMFHTNGARAKPPCRMSCNKPNRLPMGAVICPWIEALEAMTKIGRLVHYKLMLVLFGWHLVYFRTGLDQSAKSWGICSVPLTSICPIPQAICFVIFETIPTLIYRPGGYGFLHFV